MSNRYLVYSSIGDRTRFPEFWLNESDKRNFDLWVTYYGDRDDEPHRAHVDRYFQTRGGKFQNFHKIYQAHSAEILAYDAVFIVDDDIQIGTEDINRLFEIRESFQLWILQPAFVPPSRVSHGITWRIPGALLHFTNFVEMCVPLFSTDALGRFMDRFDPELLSWGTDYFYIRVNGVDARNRYAVVDSIVCVNPDPPANLGREIERLGGEQDLISNFEMVARRHGIRQFMPVTHEIVYNSSPGRAVVPRQPSLHDYAARTRRICVLRSASGRHECSVSGGVEDFTLNDSALAILGLCDGRTSVAMMLMKLKDAFDLSAAEMPTLREAVDGTLHQFICRGLIRGDSAPHHASDLVVLRPEDTERRVCLSLEDRPRSIQVINLDRRRDRWLSISTALAHAGTRNVRRLTAIDSDDYPTIDAMLEAHGDRLHPDYLARRGFDIGSRRFHAKTACALSHRIALQKILDSSEVGWHIILEDDNRTLHGWNVLLDSLADTLYTREGMPDMILLSNRVGIARGHTGINDRYGTDAYAVHSSRCQRLIDSVTFSNRAFDMDYSLDNHFSNLCASGALDIVLLENGPWIDNLGTGRDSDIEVS